MATIRQTPVSSYTATAGQTDFPITFNFSNRSDETVAVMVNDLRVTSGWSIIGLPELVAIKTSYLVRFTAGLSANDRVVITRATDLDQEVVYNPGSDITSKQTIEGLDKLTRITQEIDKKVVDTPASRPNSVAVGGDTYDWDTILKPENATFNQLDYSGISNNRVTDWKLANQNLGINGLYEIDLLNVARITPHRGSDLYAGPKFKTLYEGQITATFDSIPATTLSLGNVVTHTAIFYLKTIHKVPNAPDITSVRAVKSTDAVVWQNSNGSSNVSASILLNSFNSYVTLARDITDGGKIGIQIKLGFLLTSKLTQEQVNTLVSQLNRNVVTSITPITNQSFILEGGNNRAFFHQSTYAGTGLALTPSQLPVDEDPQNEDKLIIEKIGGEVKKVNVDQIGSGGGGGVAPTRSNIFPINVDMFSAGTRGIHVENDSSTKSITISQTDATMQFLGNFDATRNYAPNDVVFRNSQYYISQNVITAGPFNASQWRTFSGGGSSGEDNVQANWTETDTTSDAFILNKPTLAPSNAEQNVQADWTETNNALDSFIRNKPTLAPSNAEQNVQADWNETNNALDSFIRNKPALAPSNAEQNVNADWNATSGDAEILNKPTLAPSNAEQNVQSDWNETSSASDAYIQNKPTTLVADGAVTTAKIADGAVTSAKLASNAIFNGQEIDGTANADSIRFTVKEKVIGGVGASSSAYKYSPEFENVAHALYDPDATGFRGFLTFSNSASFQVFLANDVTATRILIEDPNSTTNPLRAYTSLTKFSDSTPVTTYDPFGSTHTGFTFSDNNVFDNYTEDQLRKLRFRFFNNDTELTSSQIAGYKTEAEAIKEINLEDLEAEIDKILIKEEDKTVLLENPMASGDARSPKYIQLYNSESDKSEFMDVDTFQKTIEPFHLQQDQTVSDYTYVTSTGGLLSGGQLAPRRVYITGTNFYIVAGEDEENTEFVKAILSKNFYIEIKKDASNLQTFMVTSIATINLGGSQLIFGRFVAINSVGSFALNDTVDVISHGSVVHNDVLYPSNLAPGNILYFDGTWKNLPKGTDGQVLTLVGGLPVWSDSAGGGSADLDYDVFGAPSNKTKIWGFIPNHGTITKVFYNDDVAIGEGGSNTDGAKNANNVFIRKVDSDAKTGTSTAPQNVALKLKRTRNGVVRYWETSLSHVSGGNLETGGVIDWYAYAVRSNSNNTTIPLNSTTDTIEMNIDFANGNDAFVARTSLTELPLDEVSRPNNVDPVWLYEPKLDLNPRSVDGDAIKDGTITSAKLVAGAGGGTTINVGRSIQYKIHRQLRGTAGNLNIGKVSNTGTWANPGHSYQVSEGGSDGYATPAVQIKDKSEDTFTVFTTGVVYCGNVSNNNNLGVQAKLQVQWADTESGTYNGTWTDITARSGAVNIDGYDPIIFNSKIGGPTVGGNHKDYMPSVRASMPTSILPAGVTDGKWIKVRAVWRTADNAFPNITSLYGHTIDITVYEGGNPTSTGQIGSSLIENNAITTSKIENGAITSTKIASGVIPTAETGATIKTKLAALTGNNRLEYTSIAGTPTIPTTETGATIRNKLQTLSGTNRLAASAIKDLPAAGEDNVQSNWNETDTGSDAFIQNKPTIPTAETGSTIKTKLETLTGTNRLAASAIKDLPSAGENNVQANWAETDSSADSFIQNKPTLAPSNAEQNVQSDWNATSGDALILNKPTLAPSNAEQNVNADWNATSGDALILNKPTLAPSNAEQNVQANWTETDTTSDAFIQNKPALAPSNAEQNVKSDWNATSGDAEILNKPTIPTAETGATIVTKLTGLSGTNRLPASAVRDLPSGGGGLTGEQIDALSAPDIESSDFTVFYKKIDNGAIASLARDSSSDETLASGTDNVQGLAFRFPVNGDTRSQTLMMVNVTDGRQERFDVTSSTLNNSTTLNTDGDNEQASYIATDLGFWVITASSNLANNDNANAIVGYEDFGFNPTVDKDYLTPPSAWRTAVGSDLQGLDIVTSSRIVIGINSTGVIAKYTIGSTDTVSQTLTLPTGTNRIKGIDHTASFVYVVAYSTTSNVKKLLEINLDDLTINRVIDLTSTRRNVKGFAIDRTGNKAYVLHQGSSDSNDYDSNTLEAYSVTFGPSFQDIKALASSLGGGGLTGSQSDALTSRAMDDDDIVTYWGKTVTPPTNTPNFTNYGNYNSTIINTTNESFNDIRGVTTAVRNGVRYYYVHIQADSIGFRAYTLDGVYSSSNNISEVLSSSNSNLATDNEGGNDFLIYTNYANGTGFIVTTSGSHNFTTINLGNGVAPTGLEVVTFNGTKYYYVIYGGLLRAYLANGNRVTSRDITLNSNNGSPRGLGKATINGTQYLLVGDTTDDKVYAYNVSTRSHTSSRDFNLNSNNSTPSGITAVPAVSGNSYISVSDTFNRVYRYVLSQGTSTPGSTSYTQYKTTKAGLGGSGGGTFVRNIKYAQSVTDISLTDSYSTALETPIIENVSANDALQVVASIGMGRAVSTDWFMDSVLQVSSATTSGTFSNWTTVNTAFLDFNQRETDDEITQITLNATQVYTATSSTATRYKFRVQMRETGDASLTLSGARYLSVENITTPSSGGGGGGGTPADGSITAAKLASNAVTAAKIANGAVTTDKLGSDSVTTAKIKDGAVTSAKIASGVIPNAETGSTIKTKLETLTGSSRLNYSSVQGGPPSNAEQNVNADWNSSSGDSQILNKPIIPSAETGSTIKTKLETLTGSSRLNYSSVQGGPPSNAEQNVNADWNSSSGDSQILNKPTIPTAETGSTIKNKLEALTGTNRLDASAIKDLPDRNFKFTSLSSLIFVPTTNTTLLTSPAIEIDNNETANINISLLVDISSGREFEFSLQSRSSSSSSGSFSSWSSSIFSSSFINGSNSIISGVPLTKDYIFTGNSSTNKYYQFRVIGRRIGGAGTEVSLLTPSSILIENLNSGVGGSAGGTPADGSITSAKLASNAVTTAKINASAVTTAKIADGAITAAKLASGVGGGSTRSYKYLQRTSDVNVGGNLVDYIVSPAINIPNSSLAKVFFNIYASESQYIAVRIYVRSATSESGTYSAWSQLIHTIHRFTGSVNDIYSIPLQWFYTGNSASSVWYQFRAAGFSTGTSGSPGAYVRSGSNVFVEVL